MPTSRRPKSIRTLAYAWIAVFGAIALANAGLLIWTSTEIARSTNEVTRNAERDAIADEIELRLLTYNRISNLFVLSGQITSPELATTQATLKAELRQLVTRAGHFVDSPTEKAILNEFSLNLDSYFRERAVLEAEELPADVFLKRAAPLLDQATVVINDLRIHNERQLHSSILRSSELDRLSNFSGLASIILLLLGLSSLAVGLHRNVLRPLFEFSETVTRFHKGDLEARAPEIGVRETSEIAHALNELIQALVRQRQDQLAFIAGVAHDLRNPLSALKLRVSALAKTPDSVETVNTTVGVLDRQIDRLARMVTDLLDATQIEAGHLQLNLEDIDLRLPAREIVDLYAPTSPVHQVTLNESPEPIIVRADYLRIEQVIGNLVNNAIKYSPRGGPIPVTVIQEAASAVLTVQDSGIGIPPEDIGSLFTPFHRRAATQDFAPGAGLGLSVVRRIVAGHGGRIEVKSAPGWGSSFSVRLPLKTAQVHPEAKELSARR